MGGICKKVDEVGLLIDGGAVDVEDAGVALPLTPESRLFLVEVESVCLSFPLPDKTARALSSDALATSSEPRGVLDRSVGEVVLVEDEAGLLESTCTEERRFEDDLASLASFLAAALASFSDFFRLSSSSSIDKRIASMTISSSRLLFQIYKSSSAFVVASEHVGLQ